MTLLNVVSGKLLITCVVHSIFLLKYSYWNIPVLHFNKIFKIFEDMSIKWLHSLVLLYLFPWEFFTAAPIFTCPYYFSHYGWFYFFMCYNLTQLLTFFQFIAKFLLLNIPYHKSKILLKLWLTLLTCQKMKCSRIIFFTASLLHTSRLRHWQAKSCTFWMFIISHLFCIWPHSLACKSKVTQHLLEVISSW